MLLYDLLLLLEAQKHLTIKNTEYVNTIIIIIILHAFIFYKSKEKRNLPFGRDDETKKLNVENFFSTFLRLGLFCGMYVTMHTQ